MKNQIITLIISVFIFVGCTTSGPKQLEESPEVALQRSQNHYFSVFNAGNMEDYIQEYKLENGSYPVAELVNFDSTTIYVAENDIKYSATIDPANICYLTDGEFYALGFKLEGMDNPQYSSSSDTSLQCEAGDFLKSV